MSEVLTATCAFEADSHHESAWDKAGLRRLAAAASDPLRPRLAAIPPEPYILPSLPFERNIKSYLKTGNGLSSFGIAPSRTHRSVWPICRPSFPSKRFTRARISREAVFGGNDCSRRATRTQSTRRNTLTRPVPGKRFPCREPVQVRVLLGSRHLRRKPERCGPEQAQVRRRMNVWLRKERECAGIEGLDVCGAILSSAFADLNINAITAKTPFQLGKTATALRMCVMG